MSTSISITNLVVILFTHFVADFLLQSGTMATKKSTSIKWLALHVFSYFGGLLLGMLFLMEPMLALKYGLLNLILHTVIDFFTSKINNHLYRKGYIHWFFVGFGFDQFLHAACLLVSFEYFAR